MVILDVMHKMVEDVVDEEFKSGYTNVERFYIILLWPPFMYSLIKTIINNRQ